MDQNESQNEEDSTDRHNQNRHNCHKNFIRPSSSSSIRAPSWSLGFGADPSKDGDSDGLDCHCSRMTNEKVQPDHCCGCLDESLSATRPQNAVQILPQCPTFYVTVPTVYLTRKSSTNSSSFHVYQVNIRTSAEAEWSIYRRYSQFLTLHQQLKSCDSAIGKFSFPPKRRLNSKASTIVQDRRKRLEEYMRKLCDYVVKQPVSSTHESEPYQLLTSLATTGPTKLPRSSSRSGGNSLSELGSGGSESLTNSARSEHTSHDRYEEQVDLVDEAIIEAAVDVDELSNHINELGNDDEISRRSPTSVTIEEADHLEPATSQINSPERTKTDSKKKKKSLCYIFYEFISPHGTHDAEFELDHLGV